MARNNNLQIFIAKATDLRDTIHEFGLASAEASKARNELFKLLENPGYGVRPLHGIPFDNRPPIEQPVNDDWKYLLLEEE